MEKISIRVNEKNLQVEEGTDLDFLRRTFKPHADLIIYNGFPREGNVRLKDGDEIVFIKIGEIPSYDELEALMVARHTPGIHKRLKEATVGIAGLGGLGSTVAVALARVGIGRLVIADFDLVEPSNLNRQQYFVHQIGMWKVDAMKENLSMINPYIKVDAKKVVINPENIQEVFSGCSVVVEALDRAEMKEMLINSMMRKMPQCVVIAASGLAGYGPNNEIRTIKFAKNLYVVGDLVSSAQPGRGLMAPRVGIAAHHQANQVIRVLLGEGD
ncbi:MAG: sulfur carrier protein ThiS adenylyltransferase ThiF [Candidatus Bathyarchaeia archaeon]